ncbi:MAG: metalloregulator ArsR/SmtB family transcription factor [Clostridia bacterium]|nr:metalloregulator ArsR/SmtB family transcription factor [Clostridia bacterium]
MKEELLQNSELFKMLANPVRLCILTNLVLNKRRNVTELGQCSNVAQSLVSQQLSKLKLSGIIKCEKIGNEVYYEINNEKIIKIINLINE